MNNSQGALYFGAGIDMQEWRRNIQEMRKDILGVSNTTRAQTQQMDSSFRNVGLGLATYFSGAALANFTRQIIDIRGEFQKTEIAFGTMLKSTDKAKALMGQMVELAAKTPFSLQDVSTGAKQLLAFQVPAEEVVDTLTRMGNIAAGLGVPLGRINLVYGQVMAKGKLAGDDLRQFTEAGIPMLAELAKKFNTSTAEISKMVTAGKIGFKDVQDVLFSMTNEGGMFFNLMEKQSASLSGKMSNLGDTIDQVFNKIGESNQGFLGTAIDETAYLIENYDTLIEILGVAIATYGAYKAALIAQVVWQRLSAEAALQQALAQGTLTTSQALGAAATVSLQRAQASLNATMLANPIGIVIGLLAGLSYVIYKNISATTAYEEIQGKLNEKIRKHSVSIEEQKSKIETLLKVIKDKNTSDKVAQNALEQINKLTKGRISGLTVEGIRLGQNTKALGGYIHMMEKEAKLRALIDEKIELEKRNKEIDRDNPNNLTIGDRFTNFNGVGDVFKGLSAQDRKQRAMIENRLATNKRLKENVLETQKLMQEGIKLTDEIVNTPVTNNTDEEKKIKAIKDKTRELAEVYSLNSIADLEQRISLWNEALQKASGDNVQELTKNKFGDTVKTGKTVNISSALDQVEILEKAKAKRLIEIQRLSFEEQLTETKRQIEVRDKLIQQGYSKEDTDSMFPKVKDTSFLEYLTKLEASLSLDKTKEAGENLIIVKDVLENFRGDETFLEGVNKSIDDLKSKLSGNELIDALEKFQNLDVGDNTESQRAEKAKLSQKTIDEELERQKANYEAFLKEHQSFEEQRLKITKNFDELRKQAQSQLDSGAISEPIYQEIIIKINKEESATQTDLFFQEMAKSDEWVKVFTDMNLVATTKLEEFKRILQQILSEAKTIEEKIKIGEFLNRIDDVLVKRNPLKILSESIGQYIQNLRALKQAQDDYNNAIAKYGANSEQAAMALKKLQKVQTETENSKKEAANGIAKGASEALGYIKDVKEIITDVKGAFDDLGVSLDNGFGDALEKLEGYLAGMEMQMDGMIMAAEGFVTGNPVKMIAGTIKAVAGLVKSISSVFNNDRKKERDVKKQAVVLKQLENAYNAVAFAAERMFGAQKYTGQTDLIRNLEQQKAAIQGMIGSESDKKKADQGKIDEYNAQIQAINQSIIALKEGIIKDVLQTDIPDMAAKLGDALLEAFGKGESGVEAINRAFDDLVKNMLKNQLNKIIEGQMQGVIANMRAAMGFNADGTGSFDGLTPEEIADLRAQAQAATAQGQQFIEAYSSIFDGLDSPAEGLKGDIKGITEKTAGALEAQINAIRIYQVEANNIHKANQLTFLNSLNNLIAIEFNTRRLHNIDATLADMNGKMKKGLAGFP